MFTNDSLMAHSQHLDGRTAADASRPRVADEQAAAAGPDEHREGGEEGADVEPGVQHPTHASRVVGGAAPLPLGVEPGGAASRTAGRLRISGSV